MRHEPPHLRAGLPVPHRPVRHSPGVGRRPVGLALSIGLHAAALAGFVLLARSTPMAADPEGASVDLIVESSATSGPPEPSASEPAGSAPPLLPLPLVMPAAPAVTPPPIVQAPSPVMAPPNVPASPLVTPPPTEPAPPPVIAPPTPPVTAPTNVPAPPATALPPQPVPQPAKPSKLSIAKPVHPAARPTERSATAQVRSPSHTADAAGSGAESAAPPAEHQAVRQAARPIEGLASNRQPPYPRAAQMHGEQGIVALRVTISPAGVPSMVAIEQSSGHDLLDAAAVNVMREWRFVPELRDGVAVTGTVIQKFSFRLE